MYYKKLFRIAICSLFLSACSTTSSTRPTTVYPIYPVFADPDMVAASFKYARENATNQVLRSGVEGNYYVSVTLVKVQEMPILIGVSKTKLSNKVFKKAISDTSDIPVYDRLLASNPSIKFRENVEVNPIKVNAITDSTVKNCLHHLGYTDEDIIMKRQVQLYDKNQELDHIQYILPTMSQSVVYSYESKTPISPAD